MVATAHGSLRFNARPVDWTQVSLFPLPVFACHADCLACFFYLNGLSVFADSRGNVKDVQLIQFQENIKTPSLSMPKNEGVAHLNF